ncbi:hypothetical protein INT48_001679 [Thamnidium elegans]|uniref:Catabolite repression protein creC n=1 Tax=Thamnidium elegans TaxID=101142 RepID=A0A8H7SKA3_9FUNG|nr:hypothetical protein INT48_001679 [Thamnidium elegans]
MDGYFQSTLAANSLQQNITRTNTNNALAQAAKVITHFPPTNKDFSCTELHTPDGIYPLLHETFYETIAPQFTTGTRASIINVKENTVPHLQRNDSHQFNHHLLDSSDDDGSSFNAFTMTPANKSAALPIPNAASKKQLRTPLTASLSSSSIGVTANTGLHIVTSPQKIMTHSNGNNASPYLPNSPSFPSNLTPTTPTTMAQHLTTPQQFVSGSYMMSSSQDFTANNNNNNTSGTATRDDYLISSSYNGNSSSVGSISSLFGRSSTSTHLIAGKSTPQLSSSSRNNHILSTSISNTSRPKNHLTKTNSTFVLRFLIHDNLQKLLAAKALDDEYMFFNIGSSFIWVDSKNKPKEPLSRIVFSKSYPLCHDINETTRSEDHLDIIIGFSTGDIIWYDPLSCKYVRLNKGGSMIPSAVTMIKWIPGSEELFIAVFKNGAALIMDKERDDQAFTIPESSFVDTHFNAIRPHKNTKYNPVSFWKISNRGLTDIAYSSDNIHLAITGVDGLLRIIDYRNERYFGKLTCVDWSPDGRYILTGGEDDLVTLWSFHERKMVARCQGHKSWVTGVAFDRWRCDEQTYRFGSVGEDCNLILWDFSFSALQKPKHPRGHAASPPPVKWPPTQPQHTTIDRKKSLKNHRLFRGFSSPDTTTVGIGSFGRFRKRSSKSNNLFNTHINDTDFDEEENHQHLPVLHPPLKKHQAAILLPSTVKAIHADPCTSLAFREFTLVTTDRRGRIRTWGRP